MDQTCFVFKNACFPMSFYFFLADLGGPGRHLLTDPAKYSPIFTHAYMCNSLKNKKNVVACVLASCHISVVLPFAISVCHAGGSAASVQ